MVGFYTSNIQARDISAGFIQLYNSSELNSDVENILNKGKSKGIEVNILQFTKEGIYEVKYNKNQIYNWMDENNKTVFIGLTGGATKITKKCSIANQSKDKATYARNDTTYWRDCIGNDNIRLNSLVDEDMSIVNSWISDNNPIEGFYSAYEPLSTTYYESIGNSYKKYLVLLSNKLEKWANKHNRTITLSFSGAVGDHKSDSNSTIVRKSRAFSREVLNIAREILQGKKRLKLVFILQGGSGEREVADDQLSEKIRPFFRQIREDLISSYSRDSNNPKLLENFEFWPLVEVLKLDGKNKQERVCKRLENISDMGWSSTGNYRVAVFSLDKYNDIFSTEPLCP